MINKKIIREDISVLKEALKNRNSKFDLDKIINLDSKTKQLTAEIDKLNEKRNVLSKEITIHLKNNNLQEVDKIKNEVTQIKTSISKLENESLKYNTVLFLYSFLEWIVESFLDSTPKI